MPEIDPKLKQQRIIIAICVIVALAFAGGNIIASLGIWHENDAAPPLPASTADPV